MTQLPEEKQDGCSGLFVPLKIVFHALRQQGPAIAID